jgi:hypothetical protein
MTQDEIIELAKQASFTENSEFKGCFVCNPLSLEYFAKLVAEKEREACAKVCDDHWEKDGAAYYCALTIRYRGKV